MITYIITVITFGIETRFDSTPTGNEIAKATTTPTPTTTTIERENRQTRTTSKQQSL